MDIEDLIRQYGHLTDEEIEDYVVGSLDSPSRQTVEKHLQSCVHCRTEVDILMKSLEDSMTHDGSPISENLVRQEVIRILDRIRPNYNQMWLGDRFFPLEPVEQNTNLLRIKGQLVLAGFEDAIDEDRRANVNSTIRIEGKGLPSITVPMNDFKDVNDADVEELKLAAKTEQGESRAMLDQRLRLKPIFVCYVHDRTLEVLSDESATKLFLRLT